MQESKRFGLALDQRDRTDEHRAGTPHVFHDVEVTTADLRGLLDCLCGLQWMTAGMKRTARSRYETPLAEALSHNPTDAYRILAHGPDSIRPGTADAESNRLATIRERWQEAGPSRGKRNTCTGRRPSPAYGGAGKAFAPTAALTP